MVCKALRTVMLLCARSRDSLSSVSVFRVHVLSYIRILFKTLGIRIPVKRFHLNSVAIERTAGPNGFVRRCMGTHFYRLRASLRAVPYEITRV